MGEIVAAYNAERAYAAHLRNAGPVPSLRFLAAKASCGSDSICSQKLLLELNEVKKLIDTSILPAEVKRAIKSAFFERLTRVDFRRSSKLALAIACARVMDPRNRESCLKVAEAHGISHDKSRLKLQMAAVNGPGAARANGGESCQTIADELGLSQYKAQLALQMIAVNGPGAARVRGGQPCCTVATDLGLTLYHARRVLEMIAVEGPGRARVMSGQPCSVVDRELGLSFRESRLRLQMFAVVHGPARERVMRGESFPVVAQALGISMPTAWSALRHLTEADTATRPS